MSKASPFYAMAADHLYRWLAARPETTLPRLCVIGRFLGDDLDAAAVYNLLSRLRADGRITWRSGTKALHRGHQALCIVAQGRIMKTEGCPFDPPMFVGDRAP